MNNTCSECKFYDGPFCRRYPPGDHSGYPMLAPGTPSCGEFEHSIHYDEVYVVTEETAPFVPGTLVTPLRRTETGNVLVMVLGETDPAKAVPVIDICFRRNFVRLTHSRR